MNQITIDFDAQPTATPKAKPADLILEMSRGEVLGKALKTFDKEIGTGYPIRVTQDGIWKLNQFMEYPKGVSVTGKGQACFIAEALYRILDRYYARPSNDLLPVRSDDTSVKRRTGKYGNTPTGLAKEYVKITINGKVEITTGKFTAIIPTQSETPLWSPACQRFYRIVPATKMWRFIPNSEVR